MEIYIRTKPKWVTFLRSVEDFKQFQEAYYGAPVCLGDLCLWSPQMLQKLLKLTEENPQVSVYSSQDIDFGPLFSRATAVHKTPVDLTYFDEGALQQKVTYLSLLNTTVTPDLQLLLPMAPPRVRKLILTDKDSL